MGMLMADCCSCANGFMRPDGDRAAGGWTSTPLWQKVDETPASDSDFITSDTASGFPNPKTSVCELDLTAPPSSWCNADMIIRVRARQINSPGTMRLFCSVIDSDGLTILVQIITNLTGTFADYSATTASPLDGTEGLGGAFVQLQADTQTGEVEVSWVEVEIDCP